MKYTKEQLIKAQHEYNKQYDSNPEYFKTPEEENWTAIETAEEQISYLLNFIGS